MKNLILLMSLVFSLIGYSLSAEEVKSTPDLRGKKCKKSLVNGFLEEREKPDYERGGFQETYELEPGDDAGRGYTAEDTAIDPGTF